MKQIVRVIVTTLLLLAVMAAGCGKITTTQTTTTLPIMTTASAITSTTFTGSNATTSTTTATTTRATLPTSTPTDFNNVNSVSSQPANGLSLSLSLDAKTYRPGQEISIVLDEKNTLSVPNNVLASDNWSYANLEIGPCDNGPGGFGYPYGIAIFQGNYTSLELSNATPLALYDYSLPPPCPGPMPSTAFDFKPLSDVATIISGSSSFPDSIVGMNTQLAATGYWTGVSPDVSKHSFALGVYTVVGGDEWGALVVLHFTVSQDTTGDNLATSLSANGLSLSLSLGSTSYNSVQQVTIVIDETNTLSNTNSVSASDKLPLSGLNVSSCGTLNYPFGVAVFQGYYTSGDISSATPLRIFNSTATFGCPMVLSDINRYAFQPSSDVAAIFQSSGTNPVETENMNAEAQTNGYWMASQNLNEYNFSPGVYTVVGGDEWGSLVVLHFTVSQ
jgi:hypothetical protein